MSNKRRLFRELRNTLKLKQDVPNYIPGILGAVINYQEQVNVAGRNGFVYVRVRNSDSEFIEAFNDVVATIYGLPVLLEYKGGYYRVVGRDFGRYATWGSGYGGANLANHGDQHSFGEGSNTGQDVTWVYKRQFMPLLVKPTNPFSKSISVQDDLFMWNSELKHFTGTSIDLTGAWPAPAFSRFITLYVEPTTITIQGITGSSFPSYSYAPGIEAFIPTVSSLLGIPVGSVRCDGNGTDIQWSNLYDIRTFWAGASQSQGIHISQNSIQLVTGTGIDFGAGFNVVTTGSYVYVSSTDRLSIWDDGVFKVTGTAISFNTGLTVVVTGTVAFVNNILDTFLELTDTPDSYASQASKYVRVNGAETALEFVTGANVSSFLHLLDTPKSYSGQANKYVAVNSGATALEFVSGSGGGGGGGGGINAWFPSFTPPVDADFSWVNQGSGTVSVFGTGNFIYLNAPALAGVQFRIREKAIPSSPFTWTVGYIPHSVNTTAANTGLSIRDSATGRIRTFGLGVANLWVASMNSATSFNSQQLSIGVLPSIGAILWYRISIDGVTRRFWYSGDGVNFAQVYAEAKATWTASPSHIGFWANAENATYPAGITIVSWKEESGVP